MSTFRHGEPAFPVIYEHSDSLLGSQRLQECAHNDAALDAGRRIVPYHTGRIAIGCAWTPRPPVIEGDAIAIQRALLSPRTEQPASGLRRVLSFLWSLT